MESREPSEPSSGEKLDVVLTWGKELMKRKNYHQAVDVLGQALKFISQHSGDSIQSGEALACYGKANLELYKIKKLGNSRLCAQVTGERILGGDRTLMGGDVGATVVEGASGGNILGDDVSETILGGGFDLDLLGGAAGGGDTILEDIGGAFGGIVRWTNVGEPGDSLLTYLLRTTDEFSSVITGEEAVERAQKSFRKYNKYAETRLFNDVNNDEEFNAWIESESPMESPRMDSEGDHDDIQFKMDDNGGDNRVESPTEDLNNLSIAAGAAKMAKQMFKNLAEIKEDEDKKKTELKYCEISLLVGEISLETEDYPLAKTVFSVCLEQVQSMLSADSRVRLISENYYWLGLTYTFLEMFGEAESHLRSAIAMFQERIINLEKNESSNDGVAFKKNPTEKDEKTELNDRIKEMEMKIDEIIAKRFAKMEVTRSREKNSSLVKEASLGPPAS